MAGRNSAVPLVDEYSDLRDMEILRQKSISNDSYSMKDMVDLHASTELSAAYVSAYGNLALVSALFLALTLRSPTMSSYVNGTNNLWGNNLMNAAAQIADALLALSTLANIACVYECLSILCRLSEVPAVYTKIYIREVGARYIRLPYDLNDVGFLTFVTGISLYYTVILHYISGYGIAAIGILVILNHYFGFWFTSHPARVRLFEYLKEQLDRNCVLKMKYSQFEETIDKMERKGIFLTALKDSRLTSEEIANICDVSLEKVKEIKTAMANQTARSSTELL